MNPGQENLDSDHFFDRLPDEIVLSVFNKIHDAKSLCLSMSVCKRFYSIIPQVEEVFLHISRKKPPVKESDNPQNFFKNLVVKAVIKPFRFISQIVKFKSKKEDNDYDYYSYHVPNEILKPFEDIRALNLRLPCQKMGSKSGKEFNSMLKWKAEFGTQLHSCVMFGAKSCIERANEEILRQNDESLLDTEVIADGELKLRIVWTISCLIVASARHYLIQEIVKEHKLIDKIVVTDESDQGKLCMNREQIEEFRQFNSKESLLENRTKLPALRMKMWYLEKLELPDSCRTMEGATLVVIRAVGGGGEVVKGKSDSDLVADAFKGGREDKVVEEALRKLMTTKRCYTLEMNAF
ncbi:F-box protein [Forsythia ovata]|uniref:F-box protein n=1 Tax=Forsythia ovata TaxID=205694 RepID=A0ABD1X8N3_9LAMI